MGDWRPSFHDPSLRLTLRQQVTVHWDANVRMLHDWRACWRFVWISLLPVPLAMAAVLCLARSQLFGAAHANAWLAATAVMALGYLLLQHLAFMVAMRRTYVPFVRVALAARGMPVCMACGHLLDPGRPETCPECGHDAPRGEAAPR